MAQHAWAPHDAAGLQIRHSRKILLMQQAGVSVLLLLPSNRHLFIIYVQPHHEAARGRMVQHARALHDAAGRQIRMPCLISSHQRQPCMRTSFSATYCMILSAVQLLCCQIFVEFCSTTLKLLLQQQRQTEFESKNGGSCSTRLFPHVSFTFPWPTASSYPSPDRCSNRRLHAPSLCQFRRSLEENTRMPVASTWSNARLQDVQADGCTCYSALGCLVAGHRWANTRHC